MYVKYAKNHIYLVLIVHMSSLLLLDSRHHESKWLFLINFWFILLPGTMPITSQTLNVGWICEKEQKWGRVNINSKLSLYFLSRQITQPAILPKTVLLQVYVEHCRATEDFSLWWLNSCHWYSQVAGEWNKRNDQTSSPLIMLSSSVTLFPKMAGGINILLLSRRCWLDAQALRDAGRYSRRGANFLYTDSTDYTVSVHSACAKVPLGLTAANFLIYRFHFLWCLIFLRLSWQTIFDDRLQKRDSY